MVQEKATGWRKAVYVGFALLALGIFLFLFNKIVIGLEGNLFLRIIGFLFLATIETFLITLMAVFLVGIVMILVLGLSKKEFKNKFNIYENDKGETFYNTDFKAIIKTFTPEISVPFVFKVAPHFKGSSFFESIEGYHVALTIDPIHFSSIQPNELMENVKSQFVAHLQVEDIVFPKISVSLESSYKEEKTFITA